MAIVQTPYTMTLTTQQKIFNVIQQSQTHPSHELQNCLTSGTQPTTKSVIQSKRPILSATTNHMERSSVLVTTTNPDHNDQLRYKRKIQCLPYGVQPAPHHHHHHHHHQPASVARRNARERNRVKQVNNGFATLRQHIPASIATAFAPQGPATGRGASKKLSKVETLRLAVEYIRSLQQLIDDHENDMSGGNSSASSDISSINNDSHRYYTNSPEESLTSQQQQQQQQQQQIPNPYNSYPILIPLSTCSEASSSPTPSHSSDGSFSAGSSTTYTTHFYQEKYEPKSPEDEELLDAIFSWQQE